MANHLRRQNHHCSRLAAALVAAMLLISAAVPSAAKLSTGYYRKSCPRVEQIVADIVTNKQINSPTTAAGALRLFFHDCFVGGCDASVLVSTNAFNRAERDADINLSLPGDAFDAVVRAKTALELQCPGAVSCADILALATRDLVSMLGGPFYAVPLGRKDGLVSRAAAVEGNLPLTNMTVDTMAALFRRKGFTVQEMVTLAGAHTVGFSHCKEFAGRIFRRSSGGQGAFDPAMEPRFAQALQRACANYQKDATVSVFNDIMTPGKFDNIYYLNLKRGLGLLASDHALVADARTKPFVDLYAANQSAFFGDFSRAMVKLSLVGVKTGRNGEVRRRCDQFNNLST
ncbi:peroxidase 31-like [Canna indica]|uniref:Peroxidase n=1 Tax=Canna indica TaxID=4628 RepID=A0AAQ3QEQ3_9LILI|nr:peroxidase 31-like [Canna indica]